MVEIPLFMIMNEINLINSLEKISSHIPSRLLKLQGYLIKNNFKEDLEIIIYKGFSSSTTHSIEIDLEKKVLGYDQIFTSFKLYRAPLKLDEKNFIKESKNSLFFLDRDNWI